MANKKNIRTNSVNRTKVTDILPIVDVSGGGTVQTIKLHTQIY